MPESLKEQRAELDAVAASFVRVPNTGVYRSKQYPGYVTLKDGEL